MKNNGIDTVNETEKIEFKENTDFFRMSDGVFWTIDSLCKKYNTAQNTIYSKANRFDIKSMKVLGITCYKDDARFEKQPRNTSTEHLKPHNLMSYAQLHRKVEEATEAMGKAIGEMFATRVEINFTNDEVSRLTHFLQNMNEIIVKNEETLNAILSYLTNGEKKDA